MDAKIISAGHFGVTLNDAFILLFVVTDVMHGKPMCLPFIVYGVTYVIEQRACEFPRKVYAFYFARTQVRFCFFIRHDHLSSKQN